MRGGKNVAAYLLLSFESSSVWSLFFVSALKHSCSTITLVGAKKRKRNASSDHSDGELSPASPAALEDELIMVLKCISTDLITECQQI